MVDRKTYNTIKYIRGKTCCQEATRSREGGAQREAAGMVRVWSCLRIFMAGKEHRYNRKQHLKDPMQTPGSSLLSLITTISPSSGRNAAKDSHLLQPPTSLSPALPQPPSSAKGSSSFCPRHRPLSPRSSPRLDLFLVFSIHLKMYRTLHLLGKIYKSLLSVPLTLLGNWVHTCL